MWILVDGQSINFWLNNRMEDSPPVDKINQNTIHLIEKNVKVNDFITPTKHWEADSLVNILSITRLNPIRISDFDDRITWRFMLHGGFSIK